MFYKSGIIILKCRTLIRANNTYRLNGTKIRMRDNELFYDTFGVIMVACYVFAVGIFLSYCIDMICMELNIELWICWLADTATRQSKCCVIRQLCLWLRWRYCFFFVVVVVFFRMVEFFFTPKLFILLYLKLVTYEHIKVIIDILMCVSCST